MKRHSENTSEPNENAARLYRAVGQIDDRFISEAIDYKRPHQRSARILPPPKVMASVAAAILAVTVALGLFAGNLLPHSGDGGEAGDTPPVVWAAADGYRENTALLSCLAESRHAAVASAEAPVLSGKKMQIIWRDAKDGTYYTVTVDFLSEAKTRELYELLGRAAAEQVAPGTEAPPFSLWIALGDKTAVSPYLPMEGGNVSYGTLSDYAPEQLPAEALASFLTDLIGKNLD